MNKKGVSAIIGYALLVVFALIISVGVYAWLKTYIPKEALNCPDGTSILVRNVTFSQSSRYLNITLENNGRFDVAGYLIHGKNNLSKEVYQVDLSGYLNQNSTATIFGNSVVLGIIGDNIFSPGEQKTNSFSIPVAVGTIYSVRIIPTRFQDEDNRQRFVICSYSRIKEVI